MDLIHQMVNAIVVYYIVITVQMWNVLLVHLDGHFIILVNVGAKCSIQNLIIAA